MTHIHKKSGKKFEVGQVVDQNDGCTYDINVIMMFPDFDDENFDEDTSDLEVKMIGFYFGDYDEETTDDYIDMYFDEHQS
jgi:hypothetical protein